MGGLVITEASSIPAIKREYRMESRKSLCCNNIDTPISSSPEGVAP